MPLASEQSFRDKFNFRDTSIDLADYLNTANTEVKAWVGPDTYADAEKLTDGNPETAPTDLPRAYRLKLAETYLAMYYAYPALSIQVESGVILLSDRSQHEVVRQFNRPKDISAGAQVFWDQAQDLASPYLVAPEVASPSYTTPAFVVVK